MRIKAFALTILALTWLGTITAQAQPNPPEPVTPAALSWDATTPPALFRGLSDWLVESGQRTPARAFGPFPGKQYKVGDTERFFALDFTAPSDQPPRKLTATLKLITDHAYWWFENGTKADSVALQAAGERFEQDIYPLDHKVFGSEWSPGIDGDPHIFILHQKQIGGGAVGVFDSRDECARSICPNSNQHEMLYIGLDFGPVDSPQELTVIAHEFQHLIRYNNVTSSQDRWLDEGFAQLAEHLNGSSPDLVLGSGLDALMHAPDLQLNSWPSDPGTDPTLNYADSYLFCVYLYQRFGVPFIQAAAASPFKGLAALEHTLHDLKIGETIDQVFTDWTIANEVNSPSVSDGRYYYQSLSLPRRPTTIQLNPGVTKKDNVNEYGVEYLNLSQPGTYTITFSGQRTVALVPVQPPNGQWMWWSYNLPHGATRLERTFDLSAAHNASLTFKAWWDIQSDVDLAHVLVSSNDGQTWKSVPGTDTTDCAIGGPCYTGQSHGWKTETVNLSAYDGQLIRLRFEYMTQLGNTGDGFFLTDIHLAAIGFADDVQHSAGDWQANGFMRIAQSVPQYWALNAITTGSSTKAPQVIPLSLDARNSGSFKLIVPPGGVTLVLDAMSPFVQGTASYTLVVRSTVR